MIRPVLALVLIGSVLGCNMPLVPIGPEVPPHAVPYEAPATYSCWWAELIAESGLPAKSMDRIRWHVVQSGPWYSTRYRKTIQASWLPDGRVYIARGWTGDEGAVKHEMLHELLDGDAEHSHPLFRKYNPSANPAVPGRC